MERWFRYFDKSNRGYIDAEKLDFVMMVVGQNITKKEAHDLVKSHGIDGRYMHNGYAEEDKSSFVSTLC